jgi:hypothetical protein
MRAANRDAAVVRSILRELGDTAGIDWSLPLMDLPQDQVISFLLRAQQLIAAAEEAELDGETSDPGATFVMTLRPLREVNPIRSLRCVLKSLLRQYGMRCVDLQECK